MSNHAELDTVIIGFVNFADIFSQANAASDLVPNQKILASYLDQTALPESSDLESKQADSIQKIMLERAAIIIDFIGALSDQSAILDQVDNPNIFSADDSSNVISVQNGLSKDQAKYIKTAKVLIKKYADSGNIQEELSEKLEAAIAAKQSINETTQSNSTIINTQFYRASLKYSTEYAVNLMRHLALDLLCVAQGPETCVAENLDAMNPRFVETAQLLNVAKALSSHLKPRSI